MQALLESKISRNFFSSTLTCTIEVCVKKPTLYYVVTADQTKPLDSLTKTSFLITCVVKRILRGSREEYFCEACAQTLCGGDRSTSIQRYLRDLLQLVIAPFKYVRHKSLDSVKHSAVHL